jgi:hypothetical protein
MTMRFTVGKAVCLTLFLNGSLMFANRRKSGRTLQLAEEAKARDRAQLDRLKKGDTRASVPGSSSFQSRM